MKLCVISFKACWLDEQGRWMSDGGFPLQMAAVSSLFAHTTLVVTATSRRGGGIPLPAEANVIALREPKRSDFARKVDVLLNLSYYVRQFVTQIRKADVIHTPVPGDLALLGMLTALAMRKRLVARYCGVWDTSSTSVNRFTKAVMRWTAGGRNVMLATGVGDREPAPRMFWSRASVISSEELDQVRPDLARGLFSPPRLVCVGRLSEEKGVADLLRAMGLLAEKQMLPPGQLPLLTICGGGPLRGELERLTNSLALQSRVVFRGQLNRGELFATLQQQDILVMPSRFEAVCKARLDGMLAGLPSVSTLVGSSREIVGADGERGWLTPAGDPAAMAATIARVLPSPTAWPALRARCRAFAEEFTLERWAEDIACCCSRQWGLPMANGRH